MRKFKELLENLMYNIESKENEDEKHEMALNQLHFIEYAAKEIKDHIINGGELEEWYQNKMSKVHSDMESLHSHMEGESRRLGLKEANVYDFHELDASAKKHNDNDLEIAANKEKLKKKTPEHGEIHFKDLMKSAQPELNKIQNKK